MNIPNRVFVLIVSQSFAIAAAAQSAPGLDARFTALLARQYSAMSSADTAALSSGLANDLVWVYGANGSTVNKTQLLAAAAHVQTPAPRFEIDSVHATIFGNTTAVVEYRRTDHRDIGAYRTQSTNRVLDVFRKQHDVWLLARHTQTWIVSSPPPIALDSGALAAFVGRYEVGPGYVDDVHWSDGHLVAQSSVESVGAALVPVSETAFSPNGIAPLIVFERDSAGRVTGYVQQIPDGGVIRARRLP